MWCADVLWHRVAYSYFVQIRSPSICCLRLEKALLVRNGGHRVPAMFLCRVSVVRITLSALTRTLLLRYSPAPYCKSTMTSCKFIDRRGNVESDMACEASRSTPSRLRKQREGRAIARRADGEEMRHVPSLPHRAEPVHTRPSPDEDGYSPAQLPLNCLARRPSDWVCCPLAVLPVLGTSPPAYSHHQPASSLQRTHSSKLYLLSESTYMTRPRLFYPLR